MDKINKMLKESEENIEYEIYIQVSRDYSDKGKTSRKFTYICERKSLTDDERIIMESGFNEDGCTTNSKLGRLLRK